MTALYFHIPFCSKICHYCDFAKTSRYDDEVVRKFFSALQKEFERWNVSSEKFSSVFFGGGTPSLFSTEYEPLFSALGPNVSKSTEVSLEANPNDVNLESLKIWKSLGINRISIGVQSLRDEGLKVLTRDHDRRAAINAIQLAQQEIPNKLNVDLIYGWPGQTMEFWKQDLKDVVELGVPHLSLYCLTFEGRTPFARAHRKGKMSEFPDMVLESFYQYACSFLEEHGYIHDEVSNWSLPNQSCEHNWSYWSDDSYIGVGPGAHGYTAGGIGKRWHYHASLKTFLAQPKAIYEPERTTDMWLMEYVSSSLRTRRGVDINLLEERGYHWGVASATIQKGLDDGFLTCEHKTLKLQPQEWFRETAWSLALVLSLQT